TIWVARAKVAAALHLFVTQFDMRREEAAKKIARDLPQLRYLIARKGAPLENSIIAWREQFNKDRVKNRLATTAYHDMIQIARKWQAPTALLKDWVHWNLGEAARAAQQIARELGV